MRAFFCVRVRRVSPLAGLAIGLMAQAAGGATINATSAVAQSKPAPAPASSGASAQPGSTTAAFDDWVLTCQRAGPADKQIRVCEVGQIIRAQVQGQDQQNPVARVAIGRLNKGDPLHLTALLPPNVMFPSTVRIGFGDADPGALELPWHRCVSGFCQADMDIKDEQLKPWRATTEAARITFKDAAGRAVSVPLSMKGLGPALDQLAKEGP